MKDKNLLQEFTDLSCEDIKREHIIELKDWSKNWSGQLAIIHIQKLILLVEYLMNKDVVE